MKLHVFPGSPNCKKVLFTAYHLGLNFDLNIIDLKAGAHKNPSFIRLNPNCKVPVLELDNGKTIWESNAIINRLASERATDIWPATNERYEIMQWQFWESCHWTPAISPFLGKHLFNRDIDLTQATQDFEKYAAVMNGHLESNKWLVSNRLTTADIAVAPILCYWQQCQVPLKPYGHITRWFEEFRKLPAWQKVSTLQ